MLAFQHREVYYPYMPSIVGKRRGKQTYYYLVESARVDGKPRIVSQEYLGTAEEVMARLQGTDSGLPDRTQHKRFGDVAAVWGFCQQLGVADIVDEVVGDRRSDVAVSVGTYLTLATVNRIVDPCSKRAFAEGWDTTAGPRFVRPRLPAGVAARTEVPRWCPTTRRTPSSSTDRRSGSPSRASGRSPPTRPRPNAGRRRPRRRCRPRQAAGRTPTPQPRHRTVCAGCGPASPNRCPAGGP